MKEDIRKVQLTGKSTYIVSLPHKWVKEVGLTKGEMLTIIEQNDKSLLLTIKDSKKPAKPTEVSINIFPIDKASSIIRKVIALYLVGFNTIHVKANEERMQLEQREKVKHFIRNLLVGTEIVADSKNTMDLQVLLSSPELSVADTLRRIAIIATSMRKDALMSITDLNYELAEDVIKTDDEIDRFSFYIIRQLMAAINDETIMKDISLENARDCLGYQLITKSVERVGDHAVSIAKNVLTLKQLVDVEIVKALSEMSFLAIADFEDSITSLFKRDYFLADEVVERKDHIEQYWKEATDHILSKKLDAETTSSLRLIIESIKRTAEYGSDIAEVVLNLTVSNL